MPIHIVVEDELSEHITRRLLARATCSFACDTVLGRQGQGYIRKRIIGFNRAAQGTPYFVLTDLDSSDCAPSLMNMWLPGQQRHPNLLMRVAVREVEAWLLADRDAFAAFLGIWPSSVPVDPESVADPKKLLLTLAERSRKRTIKRDILPGRLSRKVGPNYNGCLGAFVMKDWDPRRAAGNSPSLRRALARMDEFRPYWRDKKD